MTAKILIPLCAAAALLAACSRHDDGQSGTYSRDANGTGVDDSTTPGAGDTATTPGGNAGDPSTTPPSTTSSPDAQPPAETAPANPPPGGG